MSNTVNNTTVSDTRIGSIEPLLSPDDIRGCYPTNDFQKKVVVDARNELHIKWLKFMGFKFIQRHENFGVAKLPFYEFLRI